MELIAKLINRLGIGPRCALIGVVFAAAVLGCDMQGVPLPGTSDAALQAVCEPGEQVCDGPLLQVCTDEGVYEHIECAASTSCENGACRPIETHCDGTLEDDDSLSDFSVSPQALVFETDEQFKSSTASLDITNCSTDDLRLIDVRPYDPNRVGSRDVFTLHRSELQPGDSIGAGETRSISVRYEPQYAFSREKGKLNVELLGSRYRQFHVELIPKAHCVTATPEIELGIVDGPVNRRAHVQNCGTEPVQLDGVHVNASRSPSPVALQHMEFPTVLLPGEHLALPFDVDATGDATPGRFADHIVIDVADADRYPEPLGTTVTGHLVTQACRDRELAAPTIWTEQSAQADGWSHRVRLGERIHIQSNSTQADRETATGQTFFELEAPHGSRARLEPTLSEITEPNQTSFVTDVAGVYEIELDEVDESGAALCDKDPQGDEQAEPHTLTLDARPTAALYVDLQWITVGDLISADVGYGRGGDLNLHLIAHDELVESTGLSSPEEACFGYGEYPLPSNLDDLPTADIAECGSTGAQVHSLSVSGAHREVMTVDEVDRRYYYIGVSAFSIYEFPRAFFRLSVYADGTPVDDIELHEPWWPDEEYDNLPESLDDLLTYELGGEEVWVFGVWDARENRLLPRPPRRFPRDFP
ncbi:MAG: hypothetical protein ACLFVJ_21130 [Persicimonas sp.]